MGSILREEKRLRGKRPLVHRQRPWSASKRRTGLKPAVPVLGPKFYIQGATLKAAWMAAGSIFNSTK